MFVRNARWTIIAVTLVAAACGGSGVVDQGRSTGPAEPAGVAAAPPATDAATAPPAAAPPAAPPPATQAPAPPAGRGQLAINQSGAQVTDDCAGRPVGITGSTNHITLTGDCPRVAIVGSNNTVVVDRVDAVQITGSFDHVTWHGTITGTQPMVSASGQGDVVARG